MPLCLPENPAPILSFESFDVWEPCVPPNYPPFYKWYKSKRRLVVYVPKDRETLPDFTGELLLQEMQELNISGGGNLKSLPDSIATLSHLESLDLDSFDGPELPPLPNLSGLVSLKTVGFQLCKMKSIPASIMGLTNLESLDIQKCYDLEILPTNWNCFVSLKTFRICGTSIKFLPNITGLTNLESLDIEECYDLEVLPTNWNGMVSLKTLRICGTSIKSLSNSIMGLTTLESLHIEGCDGLKALPVNWNGLVRLKKLSIGDYNNIKSLPQSIMGLTTLEDLYIASCDGLEALPTNWNGLVSLKTLYIAFNTNIKSLPDTIMGLTNLEYIDIRCCDGLKALPSNWSGLVRLKKLLIYDNTNIKSLPNSIVGLTNLEALDCSRTGLEALPSKLNGLLTLKFLDIPDTKIKSLPECITTLQKLEYINLDGYFSLKELPENLNKLAKLQIKFPRPGEGLVNYIAIPAPPEQETLNEDGTAVILNKNLEKECGVPTNVNEQAIRDCCDQDLTRADTTDNIDGERTAHYVAVPPHGLESLNGHGMAHFDEHMRAPASSLQNGRDGFGSRNNHHAENENILNKTLEEKHEKGKRSVMQVDTTLQLGGPYKQRRSASEDKSHSLSSCASNSSVLKLITLASGANPEHPQESLDQHGWSGRARSIYLKMNKLLPNTSTLAVKETATATPNEVCSYGSGVSPCPLVVKGTYKEETFMFEFSCTPDFNELNEQVGKKLEPVLNKYQMKFKDIDGDWVLMKDDSDLKYCLRVLKSSDEDIVRLKVVDL